MIIGVRYSFSGKEGFDVFVEEGDIFFYVWCFFGYCNVSWG